MDRNKRVSIFLTLVVIFVIAGIGFTIYVGFKFTIGFADTVTSIHSGIKEVHSKDTIYLNRDINDLKAYAIRYEPTDIDFSKNDTLNTFDLKYMYSKQGEKSIIENDEITDILLLKLYLFHLKHSHQGYDLKSMSRGQAKYIIDYYFQSNRIDITTEMYNTGFIYETIKAKKNKSKGLVDYLKSIESEQKSIGNYFGKY